MTEKNKAQINENDKKITALENIISDELKKSDTAVDTDLIEECLDYIMELKSIESSEAFRYSGSFTEEELEINAKSLIEKKSRGKNKKPPFIRMRRKALIAVACMIIFMTALTVIAYSYDQEGVFNSHIPEIVKLGRGESMRIGNTEYWHTSDNPVYSDVHDLIETESIESMLFPSFLENYTPYLIMETLRNKVISYEFIYNEEYNVYYDMKKNSPDSSDFSERYADYDAVNVNGIDYYVKSYEPDSPYYAYFTDGYYEYLLKCDTYEIIIEIINSIAVYSSDSAK